MASTSETGHAKNVENWQSATNHCKQYGPSYAPTNSALTVTAMEAKFAVADAAVKAVEPLLIAYRKLTNIRMVDFDLMEEVATRAVDALISSEDVSTVSVDAATSLLKKIKGSSSKSKGTATPTTGTTPPPSPKKHSTSQQSYDLKLSNYKKLVEVLKADPKYKFSDADLDPVELEKLFKKLDKENDDAKNAYDPYLKALKVRDTELYADKTGVYDLSQTLKSFVSSILKTKLSATEKKLVLKLKFKKPATKDLHL